MAKKTESFLGLSPTAPEVSFRRTSSGEIVPHGSVPARRDPGIGDVLFAQIMGFEAYQEKARRANEAMAQIDIHAVVRFSETSQEIEEVRAQARPTPFHQSYVSEFCDTMIKLYAKQSQGVCVVAGYRIAELVHTPVFVSAQPAPPRRGRLDRWWHGE